VKKRPISNQVVAIRMLDESPWRFLSVPARQQFAGSCRIRSCAAWQ